MTKFLRKRLVGKIFIGILLFLLLVALISIRLVDESPYQNSEYYRETIQALDSLLQATVVPEPARLIIGAGKAGFTPPVGVALAGYGDRKGAPSTGVHDSLFIRALVLQSGNRRFVILGYDALLCPPEIARTVEDSLQAKFALHPEQILFTATHTHSGAGGWSNGWVEKQFAGPPDSRIPALFVDSTLAALRRAFHTLQPGTFSFGRVHVPAFVRNRLVGENGDVDDELVFLVFTRNKRIKAVLATYSAHATVLSARNMLFSGDYPGYFERKVETGTGGMTLFAAAGVGSHAPKGRGSGFEKAERIGTGLADSLLTHLPQVRESTCRLQFFRLPVAMHDLQIRLGGRFRIAPWIARKFFHVQDSYLQVVLLDRLLILGSPAEFSGELAKSVKTYARKNDLETTITSFNGCYLGYVTPSKYAVMPGYETRLMSFFGPYTGEYLSELMRRIVDGMAEKVRSTPSS